MKSKKNRIFMVDGIPYRFNNSAFKSCMVNYGKINNITKDKTMDELSGKLGVTKDAVNNWQYGRNGLSNPENIKKAADFLHIDWLLLVKKVDGEITMFKLTERQKDAAKRIYDILIWFLEEFSNTDGFSSWWQEFKEQGVYDREEAIFERITRMEEKVRLVLNQEYFDLHDHDIYDEFCEFAGEDLVNVYNGKINCDYTFEADDENTPIIWQDYEKAMQHLNEIIERIV